MRKSLVFLLAIAMLALSACAFNPAPATSPNGGDSVLNAIPKTLRAVCGVWKVIRDVYPDLRATAVLLRPQIEALDADVWKSLEYVDAHAKDLDRWLALVCREDSGEPVTHLIAAEEAKAGKGGIQWDLLGSGVLKLAEIGLKVYQAKN